MTFTPFARRKAVLSASKTSALQRAAVGRAAGLTVLLRRRTVAGGWRRAVMIGLLAATAEAANLAVNGVGDLPWPGLAQIAAGYIAFVALLVWVRGSGAVGAGRGRPRNKHDEETRQASAIRGER